MKTTLDIHDELFARAKQRARESGRPLRAVVEEGLRLVLEVSEPAPSYRMPDRSVGDPAAKDPLESLTWDDLRREVYGETPGR